MVLASNVQLSHRYSMFQCRYGFTLSFVTTKQHSQWDVVPWPPWRHSVRTSKRASAVCEPSQPMLHWFLKHLHSILVYLTISPCMTPLFHLSTLCWITPVPCGSYTLSSFFLIQLIASFPNGQNFSLFVPVYNSQWP